MLQNNNIPDDLLQKLQKLKNLEEGARSVGSLSEAENAAAKLQDLLLKHNLDWEQVISHGVKKKAEMFHERFNLDEHQSKSEAGWLYDLFKAVSHACMCRVVYHSTYRHRYDQGEITVLGEKHNVAMVFYMVEQVISKIDIAWKLAWKDYLGDEKRNTFRRGFLRGAVHAIGKRLIDNEEETIKEQSHQQGGVEPTKSTMALMIVSKRELAKEYTHKIFPNLTYSRSYQKGLSGLGGYVRGQEAGSKMQLHRGVKNNSNNTKQIGQ